MDDIIGRLSSFNEGPLFRLLLPSRSTTRCLGSNDGMVIRCVFRPPLLSSPLNMNTDEERLEAAIDDELVLWLVVVFDDVCICVGLVVSICASCLLSSFAADF